MKPRPVATTHSQIEQAAFRLFAERGSEATTLDDIARSVGVSWRTLFRDFDSKNDIPGGQLTARFADFRALLDAMPEDLPFARRHAHRLGTSAESAQGGHRR